MWLLGVILLIIGIVLSIKILFWLGVILLVIGVVLYVALSSNESRRWYW